MAYVSGHLQVVTVTGGVPPTWTADLRSVTTSHNIMLHDVTIFGDVVRRRIVGNQDFTLNFEAVFDDGQALTDYVLDGATLTFVVNYSSGAATIDKCTYVAIMQNYSFKKDVDDAVRVTGSALCSSGSTAPAYS